MIELSPFQCYTHLEIPKTLDNIVRFLQPYFKKIVNLVKENSPEYLLFVFLNFILIIQFSYGYENEYFNCDINLSLLLNF